jgi:hypothetical protein
MAICLLLAVLATAWFLSEDANAAPYTLSSGEVSGFFDFNPNADVATAHMTDRLFSYTVNSIAHHWTVTDSNYYYKPSGSFISTNANNLTLTFQFCFEDCRMIQGTIPLQYAYTANVFDNNRAFRPASTTGFFSTAVIPDAIASSLTQSVPVPSMFWLTLSMMAGLPVLRQRLLA